MKKYIIAGLLILLPNSMHSMQFARSVIGPITIMAGTKYKKPLNFCAKKISHEIDWTTINITPKPIDISFSTIVADFNDSLQAFLRDTDDTTHEKITDLITDSEIEKTVTRSEAIAKIQECTRKLLDTDDTRTLGEHVDEIVSYAHDLDPEIDAQYIKTIDFLNKNKTKTGYWGLLFWSSQASKLNLTEDLPIHPDLLELSESEIQSRLTFRLKQ